MEKQTKTLNLPKFRLTSGIFRFLLKFCAKDCIQIQEYHNFDQFKPTFAISNENIENRIDKIIEIILQSCSFPSYFSFDSDVDSQDYTYILKEYQNLINISFKDDFLKKEDTKFFFQIFNQKEIDLDIMFKNPITSILLFESINALMQVDDKFVANNIIQNFYKKILTHDSYKSYIFDPQIYLMPISTSIPNNILNIHSKIKQHLSTIIDFASLNGALYTYTFEKTSLKYWDHIPLSPFPTLSIKKSVFDNMREKSLLWNKLFLRMVKRIEIFDEVFETLSQVDIFVNHLWKLLQKKRALKRTSQYEFCIFRNDYLKDNFLDQWKQVFF